MHHERANISAIFTSFVLGILACQLIFRWVPRMVASESKTGLVTSRQTGVTLPDALPKPRPMPQSKPLLSFPTDIERIDEQIEELSRESFPEGNVALRSEGKEGSYSIVEKTNDGESVNRLYNADGMLVSEHWVSPQGRFTRQFDDEGNLYGFTWKRPDGRRVSVSYGADGERLLRRDEYPNGDILTVRYREGRVFERLFETRNGHRLKESVQ